MTIPAICPPERPDEGGVPLEELAVGAPADVAEGRKGGILEVLGKMTPKQRFVTFEPMQQESVALGELEAQYPQRP